MVWWNVVVARTLTDPSPCVWERRAQVLALLGAKTSWLNARKMLVRPSKFLVRLLTASPSKLQVGGSAVHVAAQCKPLSGAAVAAASD